MKIDGKAIAQTIFNNLKEQVAELKTKGITPHLAIILVGDDPASKAYVGQKEKRAKEIGCNATILNYDSGITNKELIEKIKELSNDPTVNGIIVQRPLPDQIDSRQVNEATNPAKDIDAFCSTTKFKMPLAEAVLEILNSIGVDSAELKKKNIVVIGKGETGGGPVIDALRNLGAQPTVIDSKTVNPTVLIENADVIISTVGKRIIQPNELKKGVILIGVGMHKGEDGKLHADYSEDDVEKVASYYTPVPGGVGPVNVAMLLKNLVDAARLSS